MKFLCVTGTADARLTKGKVYSGGFLFMNPEPHNKNLRIVVFDNRKEWTTFDPKVFIPMSAP